MMSHASLSHSDGYAAIHPPPSPIPGRGGPAAVRPYYGPAISPFRKSLGGGMRITTDYTDFTDLKRA